MTLVLLTALKIAVWLTAVLLTVAYLTWGERKVLARLHVRVGPDRTGPLGLIQPLADAVKLMGKELLAPTGADRVPFRLAPLMIMVPAFLVWAFIPLSPTLRIADVDAGALMVLAVSSLGVYGIVVGGASSNSSYSTLGALRSAAQMVSYEVSLALAVVGVILATGTMNLTAIVEAQAEAPLVVLHPLTLVTFLVFMTAGLAETNRLPFDLPEAESELVGGYHTEYSGIGFGVFFLGEYTNVLNVSALASLLFLGGWHGPGPDGVHWVVLKTLALTFFFFWTRGTLLRPRYDQLMAFGWKVLMPAATGSLLLQGAVKAMWP